MVALPIKHDWSMTVRNKMRARVCVCEMGNANALPLFLGATEIVFRIVPLKQANPSIF